MPRQWAIPMLLFLEYLTITLYRHRTHHKLQIVFMSMWLLFFFKYNHNCIDLLCCISHAYVRHRQSHFTDTGYTISCKLCLCQCGYLFFFKYNHNFIDLLCCISHAYVRHRQNVRPTPNKFFFNLYA